MIDLHAHILPGVDDGAGELTAALDMAALAAESGVTAIVATPHSNLPGGRPNYWGPELRRRFAALEQALEEAEIPVAVLPGMEIFGTPQVPELLRQGRLISLAQSRYVLLEFPFRDYGQEATAVLAEVAALGYRPVVAHPERYRYVQSDPALLDRWVELGCLLQVNKGSLLGRFGRAEELLALALVERGFAAFVASDAHSAVVRTTWMAEVQELLCEEFSPHLARLLLESRPGQVLANEEIQLEEPDWF